MSLTFLRSRSISFISKRNRRFLCSNVLTDAPKAPVGNSTKKGWNFLKFCLVGSLTGAAAAAGYATYADSLDEINDKTRYFRESVNCSPVEGATFLDRFQDLLYSTAMTVPAKAIELYLDARRMIEEQV